MDVFFLCPSPISAFPLVALGTALGIGLLGSSLLQATSRGWLFAIGIALATAIASSILLVIAKLPIYRAGHFLHFGCKDLPPRAQRLYRIAMWLLAPPIFVLFALFLKISLR